LLSRIEIRDKVLHPVKHVVKSEGEVKNRGSKKELGKLDPALVIHHFGEVVVLHLDQNLGSMRKKLILKRNSWH
jgi:hypothetical protein